MVVRVMNMPCTSLSEMAEVTDKIIAPAAAETIPLPPILVYSNVLDHLALRGTLNQNTLDIPKDLSRTKSQAKCQTSLDQ